MQGIAALNQPPAPPQSQFGEQEAMVVGRAMDGAVRGLKPEYRAQLQEIVAELNGSSKEELQAILDVIVFLEQNKARYTEARQEAVQRFGVDLEDLPAEYNEVFFKLLGSMVRQAMANAPAQPEMEQPEVPGFAKGGIASLRGMAQKVNAAGRYDDTRLAHITPREMAALKRMGGSGTTNPRTGLPEFGFFSSIGKFFKKAAPIIGTVALGLVSGGLGLGLSPAVIGAVGSGVGSLLAGAKPADALKSALFGGLSMGVASGVGSMLGGGEFMSGFSSAFPSFLGGTAGAPGSYDLLGGIADKFGFGSGTQAMQGTQAVQGAVAPSVPLPPSAPTPFDFTKAAADTSINDIPGRVFAPGSATSVADAVKGAAAGNSGGLGGLFSDKWKTAALIGGGAALLAGMGASGEKKAPKLTSGKTGVDLLKEDPSKYGFNVANFAANNTPVVAPIQPVYYNPTPQYPGLPPMQNYGYFTPTGIPQIVAKTGGHIAGPGTGTSDSIPARLSDGEFVMTAAAVRGAGGGDRMKGARKMYDLMHKFERMA